MKRIVIAGFAIAANTVCALAAHADGFVPFFEANIVVGAANDTFYTTYLNDFKVALGQGDSDHGVAAYLPCATNPLNGPNGETPHAYDPTNDLYHGYGSGRPDMNFPCAKPAGSTALYRFYKGAPQNDHVYITSAVEASNLEALGYRFDRVEGYVYTGSGAGRVPLYRLNIGANIPSNEIDRRYTTSTSARQSLLNAGWTDDGIIGYVLQADGATSIAAQKTYTNYYNGTQMPASGSVPVSISNATPLTNPIDIYKTTFGSQNKIRPSGAYWEQVSYTLIAGGTSGGLFNNSTHVLNHFPSYVRYASHASMADMAGFPSYDGIALAIGDANLANGYGSSCGTAGQNGGQLYFELANGRVFGPGKNLLCLPHLTTDLQNFHTYQVTFGVGDSADVYVTVSDVTSGVAVPMTFTATGTTRYTASLAAYFSCPLAPGFGTLTVSTTYCVNPISINGFDAANTGYMSTILVAGLGYGTISMYQAHWLNSSGVILN